MDILYYLDIETILFTIAGYPMSYIEFFGTILIIWSVWLTSRAKVSSWPIGIIGVILYGILFYQIQLYSDMLEQIYFLVTGFIGWWVWLHPKSKEETNEEQQLKISLSTKKENIITAIILVTGTALLTYIVSNLHVWFPTYFPTAASFPFLDALTTVMSLLAQWLLVRKKVESWILWIIVDVIAIGLYWVKDVKFISIEYLLFLVIASYGLYSWYTKQSISKTHEKIQSQI